MLNFNLIVCYCNKNGIGRNNCIPWRLNDDLKHFKFITTSTHNLIENFKNIVIMGRNTWESIPKEHRPLKDRVNIVLSSKKKFLDSDKVDYIGSSFENIINYLELEMNLNNIDSSSNIFIIGGELLYKYVLENYSLNVNKIYVTELYASITCDKYFPVIDENKFYIKKVSEFKKEKDMYFRYFTYQRRENEEDKYINKEEENYKMFINNIIKTGIERNDRTGVGTISLFGHPTLRYDLSETFPLCTIKRGFLRAVFEELMLYIRGQTDNEILKNKKINIWNGNTSREFLDSRGLNDYPEGDMGETYGFNMRHFGGKYVDCKTKYDSRNGFDQLNYVIDLIKNDPQSRRILINLWNPNTLHKAALPSCLMQYQFYVDTKNKKLNLQIYLRSSDVFLANNWNVCTGSLFVHLLCNLKNINLTPGYITIVCGDAHIYKNHLEHSKNMIKRESYPFGKLIVKKQYDSIEDFVYEDISLIGYKSHPNDFKASMAI